MLSKRTIYSSVNALFVLCLACWSCNTENKVEEKSWRQYYPNISVYSSPRTADLNRDGVLDIVVGAGGAEWEKCDTAFVALDGKTGAMLWHVPARNQIVGSAVLYDITGDAIPDVILGGRSAELRAINGANGETIWEFYKAKDARAPKKDKWFNFSTPQLIRDQNGDGYKDLLIANGGDATVPPGDPARPVGYLMIVSSKDSKVLAKADMPDGKETYMSPVMAPMGNETNPTIFFGTGGETMPGHLYRTTLQDLLRNDLSAAVPLAESKIGKGFIASPVLADLTNDGVLDVIVNTAEGRMLAIDGKTNKQLWQNSFQDTECYVSPVPGYFNDDEVPDFFMMHSVGVWPQFQKIVDVAALDGRTGQIIGRHHFLNCSFTFASALTVDVNGDGFTEIVVGCNNRSTPIENKPASQFNFKLLFWDFHNEQRQYLSDSLQGINWASTPWLGDLDKDGLTDIVCLSEATNKEFNPEETSYQHPLGTNIIRKTIVDFPPERIYWGSYLGSDYNSIFTRKRTRKKGGL